MPDAVIVHHGGESSKTRSEKNYADIMIRESMLQFMRQHYAPWYADLFKVTTAVVAISRMAHLTLMWIPAALTDRKPARFSRLEEVDKYPGVVFRHANLGGQPASSTGKSLAFPVG